MTEIVGSMSGPKIILLQREESFRWDRKPVRRPPVLPSAQPTLGSISGLPSWSTGFRQSLLVCWRLFKNPVE
jgi:hypothetical protein